MKKHKIYLIHGYTASPKSNWFPHFKKELESDGVEVCILDMPNSKNPKLKEWIEHMNTSIKEFDENSIFIGHSLGCVTILNYLNTNFSKKIGGLFLISGFVEDSPIPELLQFVKPKLNYDAFIKLTENRVVVSAKDDDIINYKYAEILADKLESKFILLDKGKHFIDRDNFVEFPLLIEEVKKTINKR